MAIKLSEHFTYKKLLLFALPSIAMMIFTSIYGIVDGFFISNYVGEIAFAAVNYVIPFLMVLGAIGFMFGAGGSALIAKTLGEGDVNKANRFFSLIVYTVIILGTILGIVGFFVLEPVLYLLGAKGEMVDMCIIYGRILLLVLPFNLLQFAFQSFFPTAQLPQLGFIFTVIAGLTNIILDALFIAVFNWGVTGAAIATAISQLVGGLLPLIYFGRKNKSLLRIGKTSLDIKPLLQASYNGVSEFLSNVAMSIVSMLYNALLLKYAGENGVAAYGVLMYVGFIFFAVFIGYSMATAPLVGYNFGSENTKELKNILKRSLIIIGITSISMLLLSLLLSYPLAKLYVGYNQELMDLTVRGFDFFSFTFLFSGIAIFSSSFFTALNDGFTSALISFLRTVVFQVVSVLILSALLGIDGIWMSLVVADFLSAVIAVICLVVNKKKYRY